MSTIISLLGAESTGKTTLAAAMAEALAQDGQRVALVEEYLREFCLQVGRTPEAHEQLGIAREQTRRIAEAATTHDVVIADTTALVIAVYSDWVFGDRSLYAEAEAQQRHYQHTLLTAVDLPWNADPLRDGPHVREPVTALLRASLARAGVAYSVVSGSGPDRLRSALAAIGHRPSEDPTAGRRWRWICERCSDGDCERHLLLARDTATGRPPPAN